MISQRSATDKFSWVHATNGPQPVVPSAHSPISAASPAAVLLRYMADVAFRSAIALVSVSEITFRPSRLAISGFDDGHQRCRHNADGRHLDQNVFWPIVGPYVVNLCSDEPGPLL